MKYLKTYENKKLKQYLIIHIIKYSINEYHIIKIIKKEKNIFNPENDLQFSTLVIFWNKNPQKWKEFNDDTDTGWTSYKTLKPMIIYQSDSFEDCKKELQVFINVKKYNI